MGSNGAWHKMEMFFIIPQKGLRIYYKIWLSHTSISQANDLPSIVISISWALRPVPWITYLIDLIASTILRVSQIVKHFVLAYMVFYCLWFLLIKRLNSKLFKWTMFLSILKQFSCQKWNDVTMIINLIFFRDSERKSMSTERWVQHFRIKEIISYLTHQLLVCYHKSMDFLFFVTANMI